MVVYWFLWTVHWQRHWSHYQWCGECLEATVRRSSGIAVRCLMKPVQQEEEMEEMDVRRLEKDDILESSSWEGEYMVPCSMRSIPSAAVHWITDCGPFQSMDNCRAAACRISADRRAEIMTKVAARGNVLLWGRAHQCRIRTERSLSMAPLTTAH